MRRVDLQNCTLVALNGAVVSLYDTSGTAPAEGVAVFACGSGTQVHAEQVTLTDGLLGVSVQGGAKFAGARINVTGTQVAGLHACGTGSHLQVKRSHVYDPGTPRQGQGSADGVLVSGGAVCSFEDMAVAHAEIGIEIRTRGRATLKNCRVHGCSGSSVVVEEAGVELFDCAMELSGGCGMVLKRGAEAEAHGCTFARSTLNAVYVQQGSEAVLRWCALECSAVWSGLEVEGHGSVVECHSCLFLRNKHCGAFVHTGAQVDLSACESEGNGLSGYRVHGTNSCLRLDGCCARDVIAYQTHHNGALECAACSPGGDIMAAAVLGDRRSSSTAGDAASGSDAGVSDGVVISKRQKRGLFRALVHAIDRKRPPR